MLSEICQIFFLQICLDFLHNVTVSAAGFRNLVRWFLRDTVSDTFLLFSLFILTYEILLHIIIHLEIKFNRVGIIMVHSKDFLLNLQSLYPTFSLVEKKIADALQKSYDRAPDMTVTELAEKSDVSEASIIRFARKIGYSGYYQMKIDIVKSLVSGKESEKELSSEPDDLKALKSKAVKVALSNIRNSYDSIDMEALEKTVELISNARSIYFFAAGNSLHVALDASYKLGKLGYQAFCETVPERALLQARNMGPEDLAFAVSRSGSSKLVNQALAIVHSKNLPAVALTNYIKSPITKWCRHVLVTSNHNTMFSRELIITRLSECAVIDLIFYVLLFKKHKQSSESFTQTEEDQSHFSL
jgi:RpiR family transcriptional regulator, carbohydrate utilization regulator